MTSLEQHLTDHRPVLSPRTERLYCSCDEWAAILNLLELDAYQMHDAHVADTWRAARTVQTVEELEALPQNSMTLDPQGRVWQHIREQWVALGRLHAPSSVPFPVTILWTPEDGAL